jgi:molybdenum cofactor cytidylyltransferase
VKFGDTPIDEAEGAILVHTLRRGKLVLKKGRVIGAADVAALRAAGVWSVVTARLDAGDVGEDAAARRIAEACAGEGIAVGEPFTGRCNLTATAAGIVRLDPARVNEINAVHESATLATALPWEAVEPGQIVATVKIVTFAVPESVIARCAAIARDRTPPLGVAAFHPTNVGFLQTILPGDKASVIEKAVEVTRNRLALIGATLYREVRCGHDVDEVAQALRRLESDGCAIVLVLGASAIVDRRDVVPAAIEKAGGVNEHLGMPVDPGHLMLLARLGTARVLGIPGSARSPRLHGFDLVLRRLVAGIEVTGADVMAMGVGGLMKEIPGRPMPRARGRASTPRVKRVAALVLAAGRSTRMGSNKMMADIGGAPMIARTVDAVLASKASPVVVVTGHQPERVRAALAGRSVAFAHNAHYAEGLSTSLRVGLDALPGDIDGVIVCLGDMPGVTAAHLDRLIAAFDPDAGAAICVPSFDGKRGNPVLWSKAYFPEMREIAGDVGARHLIGAHADEIRDVAMPDSGVLDDLDTPAALAAHLAARQT